MRVEGNVITLGGTGMLRLQSDNIITPGRLYEGGGWNPFMYVERTRKHGVRVEGNVIMLGGTGMLGLQSDNIITPGRLWEGEGNTYLQ